MKKLHAKKKAVKAAKKKTTKKVSQAADVRPALTGLYQNALRLAEIKKRKDSKRHFYYKVSLVRLIAYFEKGGKKFRVKPSSHIQAVNMAVRDNMVGGIHDFRQFLGVTL